MEEVEYSRNLALMVLPCSRCTHVKKILNKAGIFDISCAFKEIHGNLEQVVCESRVCPHFSQSIDTLTKFIQQKSIFNC
ncbi:MAG: hypothetical protein ACTSWC_07440 [Promethearchaeota archaeon]